MKLVRVEKENRGSFDRYIAPVYTRQWDVVLIDGADIVPRVDCAKAALRRIASDGLLVLDDAYRVEYAEVVSILQGWRRLQFWGLGPGRRGVTKTDVYISPR